MSGIMIPITVFAWIGGIFLMAYVFSLMFGVKQSRWYQQKQLDVLIAMAHKAGVAEEELQEIMNRKVE